MGRTSRVVRARLNSCFSYTITTTIKIARYIRYFRSLSEYFVFNFSSAPGLLIYLVLREACSTREVRLLSFYFPHFLLLPTMKIIELDVYVKGFQVVYPRQVNYCANLLSACCAWGLPHTTFIMPTPHHLLFFSLRVITFSMYTI